MANECGLQCPACGEADLREEGAHGRCDNCGYRGACCW